MNWDKKRKHPRFKASENALAAMGDDPYTLMDLSAGGVGVRFCGDQPLPDEIHLDLFFLNRELSLTGIGCRKIFEARVDTGRAGQVPEWHVGLQFKDMDSEKLRTLKQFRWTED
jgi:c-di-GMP-binding flagellar brake protein YcgR